MIHVTKSYLPAKDKYAEYVEKIYRSGWLTNNGQLVQNLTARLESYLGVRNLLLVTNATIGLQIAYRVLGLSGEVITTPFSFVATTSSLVWEGLTPIFADIDSRTFCIDPDKIEEKITPLTSAILPVHVYANICEVEKVQTIANRHNIKVIYDAAHAFGVNFQEKSCLNFGDISVLSFHATKLFHSVEGGALIIKDDAVFKRASEMINFGFSSSGEPDSLGINGKMSEFHAAMGLCVLDDMPFILSDRQRVDAFYREHLPKKLQMLTIRSSVTSNYAYFPVVLSSEAQLLEVIAGFKQCHIYPRRYFYPTLNKLSYVKNVAMPISEDIANRVLCLPLYPELSEDNLNVICGILNRVVTQ